LCNWNESTKGTLEVHITYPTYARSLIPNHAAAAKRKEVLIIRVEQEFISPNPKSLSLKLIIIVIIIIVSIISSACSQ
jgi:hypothetical protein